MYNGVIAALKLMQQAINGLLDIYIFRFWGTLILMGILLITLLEVIVNHPIDNGDDGGNGKHDK